MPRRPPPLRRWRRTRRAYDRECLPTFAIDPEPVGIRALRSALGHPGLNTESDPQQNPVNRILSEMRDRGEVICHEGEWGEPRFELPAPSPGQLFRPHDHWTDEEIVNTRRSGRSTKRPRSRCRPTSIAIRSHPTTGYEKTEQIDAVDIKGNEGAKRGMLVAAASGQPVKLVGPEEHVARFRELASAFDIRVVDDD